MPVCPVCAIVSARPMEHFTPKKLDSFGKKGCCQINLGASLCQVTSWWCISHWRTSYQLIEKPHKKLSITWVSLSYASTIEVTTQLCRLGREVRYNLLRRIYQLEVRYNLPNNINLSISLKLPWPIVSKAIFVPPWWSRWPPYPTPQLPSGSYLTPSSGPEICKWYYGIILLVIVRVWQ